MKFFILQTLFKSAVYIFLLAPFIAGAQNTNLLDSFIRNSKNPSIPVKQRIDYNIAVADEISESEMEPYCLEGLRLLRQVDSVKYPYKDYLTHKTQLLIDLAYYSKAQGDFKKALVVYFDALVYAEKSKVPELIGNIYNNVGMLYYTQGQFKEALSNLLLSLKYYDPRDYSLKGRTMQNIAGAYQGMKNYRASISTYFETIKIFEAIKDTTYLGYAYNNLGVCYQYFKKKDSALFFMKKSLQIFEKLKLEDEIAWAYDCIGSSYIDSKLPDSTMKYCRRCIDIAVRRKIPGQLRNCSYNLYQASRLAGNFKDALKYYVTADSIHDSVNNNSNRIALMKAQLAYDYNKKEEKIKLESAINNIKNEEENLRTKVVLGFVLVFFIALGVFAYFIFRNYRKEKVSKEIIAGQKQIIEEKQKEVLDSIRYAKRIQNSLLASEKYIQRNMTRLKPGEKA